MPLRLIFILWFCGSAFGAVAQTGDQDPSAAPDLAVQASELDADLDRFVALETETASRLQTALSGTQSLKAELEAEGPH